MIEMQRLPSVFVGGLIGAAFGTVFVLVNSHTPLDATVGAVLRVLAVLAVAAFVALVLLTGKRVRAHGGADGPPQPVNMFGARYRWVVLGEAVLLFGGIQVLRLFDAPDEANVAWIALVVGLHFLVLARVWSRPTVLVPGAGLTALGIVGLVLASGPAVAWVPFVSGVLSGITLLAGSLAVAVRDYRAVGARGEAGP